MAKRLIVDDSPTETYKLTNILEKNDHSVLSAASEEPSAYKESSQLIKSPELMKSPQLIKNLQLINSLQCIEGT